MESTEKSTVIIREGAYSDNVGLVNLTSLAPMNGKISIRVDRKPDFFGLLEMRGSSFVIVAELKNQIIGSCSVSAMPVYLNGITQMAYYLADFKVHPDFRKLKVALELAEAVVLKLQSLHANLVFTTIISGNGAVGSFLKGSSYWPAARAAGLFNVYQIIPTSYKSKKSKYLVAESLSDSTCIGFFNDFARKFRFAPVLTAKSVENTILLTASLAGELVAAICLTDVRRKKQEVLTGLPFILRNCIGFVNAFRTIGSKNKLPGLHDNIKILYVKSFACKENHKAALKLLLSRARNIAYEKQYHFLTIGIHEKNPWKKVLIQYPTFSLQSGLYVATMNNDKDLIDLVLGGVPSLDYSLV